MDRKTAYITAAFLLFVTPVFAEGSWPEYIEGPKQECGAMDYCGLSESERPKRAVTENGCVPTKDNDWCGTDEVITIDGRKIEEPTVDNVVVPKTAPVEEPIRKPKQTTKKAKETPTVVDQIKGWEPEIHVDGDVIDINIGGVRLQFGY